MSYSNGFGVTAREAIGEKADMQELNNKLAQYMQRVIIACKLQYTTVTCLHVK